MWKSIIIFAALVAFATVLSLKLLVITCLFAVLIIFIFSKFDAPSLYSRNEKVSVKEEKEEVINVEEEVAKFSQQIDQFSMQTSKQRSKLLKQKKDSGS